MVNSNNVMMDYIRHTCVGCVPSRQDEAAMLSDEEENKECMARVCRLCYLPEEGLLRALTSKTIEVGPRKEKTTIKLKDHQVQDQGTCGQSVSPPAPSGLSSLLVRKLGSWRTRIPWTG